MGQFIYWIPGQTAKDSQIIELGLAYALMGLPLRGKTQMMGHGPDGGRGHLVAAYDHDLAYHPETQTWRQIPGSPVWIGYTNGDIPTRDDLARPELIAGDPVTLADGREWIVPIARAWTEEDGELRWLHRLPRLLGMGDDGQWTEGRVVERFARIWKIAVLWEKIRGRDKPLDPDDELEAAVYADDIDDFTVNDIVGAAAGVLKENYRIGPVEASILGLFTSDAAQQILDTTIDFPKWLDWIKKKAAESVGMNTDDGEPD